MHRPKALSRVAGFFLQFLLFICEEFPSRVSCQGGSINFPGRSQSSSYALFAKIVSETFASAELLSSVLQPEFRSRAVSWASRGQPRRMAAARKTSVPRHPTLVSRTKISSRYEPLWFQDRDGGCVLGKGEHDSYIVIFWWTITPKRKDEEKTRWWGGWWRWPGGVSAAAVTCPAATPDKAPPPLPIMTHYLSRFLSR